MLSSQTRTALRGPGLIQYVRNGSIALLYRRLKLVSPKSMCPFDLFNPSRRSPHARVRVRLPVTVLAGYLSSFHVRTLTTITMLWPLVHANVTLYPQTTKVLVTNCTLKAVLPTYRYVAPLRLLYRASLGPSVGVDRSCDAGMLAGEMHLMLEGREMSCRRWAV